MKILNSKLLRDNGPPYFYKTITNSNSTIMKYVLLFFSILVFSISAKCQLDNGIWLVGGSGKFYSYNSTYSSTTYSNEAKYTQIDLSPSIGYFIADKLAFGIKPTFSSIKGKVTTAGGGITNVQRYLIGPFGRYYLLNATKNYNIVTDVSYQIGLFDAGGQKGKLSTFSALLGPVIYFNTNVGLEFLLGYSYSKEDVEQANKEIRKGFQIGIGFQIHLEK